MSALDRPARGRGSLRRIVMSRSQREAVSRPIATGFGNQPARIGTYSEREMTDEAAPAIGIIPPGIESLALEFMAQGVGGQSGH